MSGQFLDPLLELALNSLSPMVHAYVTWEVHATA